MPELAVIVPTRGRPENIRRVISAWDFTNAWDDADLILVVDADDPEIEGYRAVQRGTEDPDTGVPLVRMIEVPVWAPMVHKLNGAALSLADTERYFALGFAGDDHLPQTINWAGKYLAELHAMGTGMVYGDDGYQGRNLSTEWAVTADAVRALGRMVPAPVEHMYCDNSMMDLYGSAGALRYLPGVRIEHMHPIVKKAETDDQYRRVNSRDQFTRDRRAYEGWKLRNATVDTTILMELRPDQPAPRPARLRPATPPRTRPNRNDRMRSGPTRERIDPVNRFPFTSQFKQVRGATPDEIGMTLADFAAQVPDHQCIVELGVFQGRTALIMAWGATQGPGAHVYGIDPWNLPGNVYDPPFTEAASRDWAEYRIRELGYSERITLIQDFSHETAERWEGKKVGLLFVDGDHTKEGARRDIEAWAQHLAVSAVIAVDDYHHPDWPGVAEAVDELVAEGFLAPVDIFHDRLAVTRLVDRATITAITSEGVSPSPVTMKSDIEVSNQDDRTEVKGWELKDVPDGTSINDLNIPQLRALAKGRGIVLGSRKDKRADIITALTEGK